MSLYYYCFRLICLSFLQLFSMSSRLLAMSALLPILIFRCDSAVTSRRVAVVALPSSSSLPSSRYRRRVTVVALPSSRYRRAIWLIRVAFVICIRVSFKFEGGVLIVTSTDSLYSCLHLRSPTYCCLVGSMHSVLLICTYELVVKEIVDVIRCLIYCVSICCL